MQFTCEICLRVGFSLTLNIISSCITSHGSAALPSIHLDRSAFEKEPLPSRVDSASPLIVHQFAEYSA
jgi:hypothetical protein